MASLAQTASDRRSAGIPVPRPADEPGSRLALVHELLAAGAVEHVLPTLGEARARARSVFAAAGGTDAADRLAAAEYAATVLVELAAEGDLDATDVDIACDALASARGEPLEAAAFELFTRTVTSRSLLELPPIVAAEIQLRLLLQLGIVEGLSLWRATPAGGVEHVLELGSEPVGRRARAAAKRALRRTPTLSLVTDASHRTAVVARFGEPHAVVVARPRSAAAAHVECYLAEAAAALAPVLEREYLLSRSAAREQALVKAGENRLMRLGFDLHDGPIQEVLVLAEDVRRLRDQVYPFVLETHRELAHGRFDDLLARLGEIDRQLREISHSLESRSVISRPLSEVLHREVDTFAERCEIRASLEIRGDAESLTAAQRIAIFRAIQESLANVREHSGATEVALRVRMRRSSVEVRITDNGHGFEVSRALARAAQRGRLGLVGIGERMRMLGGSFEIDSAPGGPTTMLMTLPRWQRIEPLDA
jgi:signal transduction histidine kinase